jgi:hypothetical protein
VPLLWQLQRAEPEGAFSEQAGHAETAAAAELSKRIRMTMSFRNKD